MECGVIGMGGREHRFSKFRLYQLLHARSKASLEPRIDIVSQSRSNAFVDTSVDGMLESPMEVIVELVPLLRAN